MRRKLVLFGSCKSSKASLGFLSESKLWLQAFLFVAYPFNFPRFVLLLRINLFWLRVEQACFSPESPQIQFDKGSFGLSDGNRIMLQQFKYFHFVLLAAKKSVIVFYMGWFLLFNEIILYKAFTKYNIWQWFQSKVWICKVIITWNNIFPRVATHWNPFPWVAKHTQLTLDSKIKENKNKKTWGRNPLMLLIHITCYR